MLSLQSCPTLCDPMDCSLPGSSAHGILQVRILEWVAMSSSRGFSQPRAWTQVSCFTGRFFTAEPPEKPFQIPCVYASSLSGVWFFVTPWTVALQASLSMGFSRQEYWSGLPWPTSGDLPNPGIESTSPSLWKDSLPSETPGKLKNTGDPGIEPGSPAVQADSLPLSCRGRPQVPWMVPNSSPSTVAIVSPPPYCFPAPAHSIIRLFVLANIMGKNVTTLFISIFA